MRLDLRSLAGALVLAGATGWLGWLSIGTLAAGNAQAQQVEVNKAFTLADESNEDAIKGLKADITKLQEKVATKEDLAELKKLTLRLLELQLEAKRSR